MLYRIAFALETSVGAPLEKQIMGTNDELTDLLEGYKAAVLATCGIRPPDLAFENT
jgi:hypothetical protein